VLDLGSLDLDEIAEALADQNDYDHCWLIDPRTGSVEFWSRDGGIDGETPVEIDELDLVPIDPLPSYEWYRDMADFAAGSATTVRAEAGPGDPGPRSIPPVQGRAARGAS
jgi:hypothetical protein